jgi:hypothetical protein
MNTTKSRKKPAAKPAEEQVATAEKAVKPVVRRTRKKVVAEVVSAEAAPVQEVVSQDLVMTIEEPNVTPVAEKLRKSDLKKTYKGAKKALKAAKKAIKVLKKSISKAFKKRDLDLIYNLSLDVEALKVIKREQKFQVKLAKIQIKNFKKGTKKSKGEKA